MGDHPCKSFAQEGGCGFFVFYLNKKNKGVMAYTAPKATGQNGDSTNLLAMLECQKATSRGRVYVQGETDFQHLSEGAPHPSLKKAVPSVGVCVYDGKVCAVRYCPDGDGDLPANENVGGADRMKSGMTWQGVLGNLEGVHVNFELNSPGTMTEETVQQKIAQNDRR